MMAPQVGRDERAPRHDALASRDGVVEHMPRETAAEPLALERRIDDRVDEHDPSWPEMELDVAGERVADVHLVPLRLVVALDADVVVGHDSTECVASGTWTVRAVSAVSTATLRGFAFSLTGIVTLRTPLE